VETPFATTARIARTRHGRVSRGQLLAEGVEAEQIKRWIRDGRLRPVHRGIYAVGHTAPSVEATYMAAVLAAGHGAALSHYADAHLLQLLPGDPPPPEVTVPTTAHRTRPGIVIHRVRQLPPQDLATLHGIRITTAPRVLLDLAPRLAPTELARACHQAWVRHGTAPRNIEACIARNPNKPGIAKLRRALAADVTLSELEDAFLKLLREHGLPLPRTNVDRHGDKVDCHWPDRDLTIELLSYRYHATRHAFEADVARRRRSEHHAYTYGDVVERAPQTAAELARTLAARGA
jgi:hypothetical protein